MGDALHSLDFRVSYGDCDPAGIIYFGAFHPMMERTYTDWTLLAGLRSDRMAEEIGAITASRASSVSYEYSPRVYDAMRCELRLGVLGTTSYTLRYDFVDPDRHLRYALASMTMVTIDPVERTAVRVPDPLRTALSAAGPAIGME